MLEKEKEHVLFNLRANGIYPSTSRTEEPTHDVLCLANCAADKEVEQTLLLSPGCQIPADDKAQIVPTTPEMWNIHGPYIYEMV